jgi:serine/threonine-protein kinase
LKGQPAVEADLRSMLGRVYLDLGDRPNAEAMYRAELALRRELLGNRHVEVARTLVDLGNSLTRDQSAEAERLLTEGLTMQRELLGNDHPAVGLTLLRLGRVHNNFGRATRAEPLLREALAIYRQHPSQDIGGPLSQLGLSLTYQGKYAEAEPIARECVAVRRKQVPSGSPLLAWALHNLGVCLQGQGRHAEAIECLREALETGRRQLPPGHEGQLYYRSTLVDSLMASDRGEEALPLIDEYLRLAQGRVRAPRMIMHRLRHFQKAKDADGCRTSAEMFERLNRTDAAFLYDAACCRAVTAAVLRATNISPEGAKSAAAEADRAMDWLNKAVAAGYADIAHVEQDKDFDALREREDFQKLVAGLEPARQRRWERELADLSRIVERNPGDAKAYRARGTHLCQTGRFREAITDVEKLMELDPQDHWAWYDAATLYLSLGDVERYRGACRQMLDRFEKPSEQQPEIAGRMAKVCVLVPDAVSDFSRVERLARLLAADTKNQTLRRWWDLTRGMIDFRAGRHAGAVEWLGRFSPKADGTHSDVSGFAVLAMAHHRLGHAGEARASLDAARAVLATKPQGATPGSSWRDWVQCELLCREAEQLLAK